MSHLRRPALVALPLLSAAAFAPLVLGTAAHAATPVDPTTDATTTLEGTLRVPGSDGFVAVADDGAQLVLDSRPAVADTVRYPAPDTTGPLVVGEHCLAAANGPGLPFAILADVSSPTACLQVRTTATAPHRVRFTADDPLSPANGLSLGLQPGGPLLALTASGGELELVTEGRVVAPALDGTELPVGSDLTGTATPGAHVVVLRDGQVLCEADAADRDADDAGRWSCTPSAALAEGTHRLELLSSTPAGQLTDPATVLVEIVGTPGPGDETGPGDDADTGDQTDPAGPASPGGSTTPGDGAIATADQASSDASAPGAPRTSARSHDRLAWTGADVTAPLLAAVGLVATGAGALVLRGRLRARARR